MGEVTRTDVAQAQARYSLAVSSTIAAEGNLKASKAAYVKVIGMEPDGLDEPTKITDLFPKSIDDAMDYALKNNYSIKQAKHNFNAQSYNVAANNGQLLPQVSLEASANKQYGDYDAKIGTDETDNVQWGVNMSIPLYSAGETRAKIRQSKYQKWQAQEQLLEAERLISANVLSAWEYMVSDRKSVV